MKIYLIRHGTTLGNEEKRYVGTTDESLSESGRKLLVSTELLCRKIAPDRLYSSPMKRCQETAQILFPGVMVDIVEGLKECNFGRFEYKNYQELNGDKQYQAWIDSGGKMGFPGGETPDEFRKRCQKAFCNVIEACWSDKVENVVFVVHGGTIMAVLDRFSEPHQDYFTWQIENGNGFLGEFDVDGQKLRDIKKLRETV